MTRLVRGLARLRLNDRDALTLARHELNKETELDHSSYRSVSKLLEGSDVMQRITKTYLAS